MRKSRYVLIPILLCVVAAVAGTLGGMPAAAQSTSGQFNPQTQFAVGSKLQITSIYGLETAPSPFAAYNNGGFANGNPLWRNGGQNRTSNQTPHNGLVNQQWNLTYLRNTPTANSSMVISVEVTNDTQDGGIIWTVQGGSIAYNGTTLTVTSGTGGIGKLGRILTIGNATDSAGNTFRWSLEGLTTLYGGSVIVALNGTVSQLNQNTAVQAPTRYNQGLTLVRLVSLTYIATIG
jgi:hypothetical protein